MKKLNMDKLEHNINEIAAYDLDRHNICGMSYCVSQGDRRFLRHFGQLSEGGAAPDDSTIFRMASMTKPVTAVAALMLCDRGMISLSEPVKKYIPAFGDIHIITPEGEDLGVTPTDVTLLHLLTHTSGIGSLKPGNLNEDDLKCYDSSIAYFLKAGLDFEPMTHQWYSAFAAFDVMASIIEQVTGQDYEEFLQTELFAPCGMTDTTFTPSAAQWERIIPMHERVEEKNAVGWTVPGCVFEGFPCAHKAAGAGLISTLSDYTAFARMLLHRGVTESGRRILSEEAVSQMGRPQVPVAVMPGNQNWGLGVRVITEESYGALPVGSFGWSGAYGTHFWVDPADDLVAVFMKNSRFDGGAGNQSACRFEWAVQGALEE